MFKSFYVQIIYSLWKNCHTDANPACIISNKTDFSPNYFNVPIIQHSDMERETKDNLLLDDNEEIVAKNDESFAVMYTSGSSGLPKGVKLKHR